MTKDTIRYHDPSMPVDLHRQIKIAAATDGVSMIEWMRQAAKEKLGSIESKEPTMHAEGGETC